MSHNPDTDLFMPSADLPQVQRGEWLAISAFDLVVEYLEADQCPGEAPVPWEVAEVSHSVVRHVGNAEEAEAVVRHLDQAYALSRPRGWDRDAIGQRARFYRASSTLRIARNG